MQAAAVQAPWQPVRQGTEACAPCTGEHPRRQSAHASRRHAKQAPDLVQAVHAGRTPCHH